MRQLSALLLLLLLPSVSHAQFRRPLAATGGMVVTAEPHATRVGVAVLEAGGNAVDAAIAIHFTLAVTLPQAGNLGGGGFLLSYRSKERDIAALDYRETAPGKAHRDMYLDAQKQPIPRKSLLGPHAVGVPGSVRGMVALHAQYATLPWKRLLAPAVNLAAIGFPMSSSLATALERHRKQLQLFAGTRAQFFRTDGSLYRKGDLFKQPALAETLRLIQDGKDKPFYEGEIARKIVAEMRRSGGLITREDLAGYRARWRKPVRTSYRKARIVSMPPPSSGGIVLAGILKQLEGFDLRRSGFGSWRTYHVMAEAMRRAYADRAKHLGDPDFHHTPKQLTQPAYWVARRRDIIADRASPSTSIKPGKLPVREKEETTHYSVVDSEGNAISATTTLNGSFGSKLSIAGFLLNNEMDDFSVKPGVPNQFGLVGGKANEVQPGKRMLSSMTPTLVFNGEGRLLLVLGSPGGSKIITTVLQVILNVLDHEMNLQQAVDAQRIHHQWLPDKLWLEKGGLYSPDTLARLKAIGHTLAYRKPMGRVQAIQLEWSSTRIRRFLGASDSRSSGLAAGLQK